KDEVGRVISEEVRRFLRSDKLRADFLQLLSGMRVEVTAQVRLVPDPDHKPGDAPRPKVEVTSVRTKGPRKKHECAAGRRRPAPSARGFSAGSSRSPWWRWGWFSGEARSFLSRTPSSGTDRSVWMWCPRRCSCGGERRCSPAPSGPTQRPAR